MKIVITGATGNIGTSTLRSLARDARVQEVVAIARRKPELQVPRTRFVAADITSTDLVPLMRGADAVIHLAWLLQPSRDVELLQRTNVEGSQRVFDAVVRAAVPSLVVSSSVGAYSPGPKDRCVDESWPTDGIRSSLYSVQKATVERQLDALENAHPGLHVARMRPALVFKRGAASEIKRLFIGPFVPRFLFGQNRLIVPHVDRLRFQCVHSHDVGRAFAMAALSGARGAFNIATYPALDADMLSETLHARKVTLREQTLRRAVSAAYSMHLVPVDPGWLDLALGSPLMSINRARDELGWQPKRSASAALLDLMDGLRSGAGMGTAPLHS
jgi:nucleoside-diphosphate-sugar epimerase